MCVSIHCIFLVFTCKGAPWLSRLLQHWSGNTCISQLWWLHGWDLELLPNGWIMWLIWHSRPPCGISFHKKNCPVYCLPSRALKQLPILYVSQHDSILSYVVLCFSSWMFPLTCLTSPAHISTTCHILHSSWPHFSPLSDIIHMGHQTQWNNGLLHQTWNLIQHNFVATRTIIAQAMFCLSRPISHLSQFCYILDHCRSGYV